MEAPLSFGRKVLSAHTAYVECWFHLSNPRGFTEKVHRFNNTARPILDTQYSETMHEDCGTLVVRVFDLKNFFPEVPHAEFDALLRLAICLLHLRNPRWRFF